MADVRDFFVCVDKVYLLNRGDVVRAVRDLRAADVPAGTLGVVFEEAGFHEKNTGPMVRWLPKGTACNVYDHDVEVQK
jgi:hypothetical protein